MRRLAWLLLLPLASSALFAQSTITSNPAPPPNGTVGVQYPTTVFSLSAATAQPSWSISVGSIPPGLTFSQVAGTINTATISGTPTTAGSYTFTVQATFSVNTALTAKTQTYTVTIALPTVSLLCGSLPGGEAGVSYSQNLTASGGYGAGTYTYAVTGGSLPPGLGLSGGAISGTPAATDAGTYSFTVQVTSQSNIYPAVTASCTFSINITALPTVSLPCGSLPGGVVGVSYLQNLTASGGYGAGTYTYASTSGSLPPGLQLNPAGAVSGMPTTAGPYSFTVQVTSHSNIYPSVTASCTFSINISPPSLTITTSSLPTGMVGVPYSQTLAASGGSPPYAWQWTGSSLPGGLTLAASTGSISGTPTAAGSFTVQITVSDSAQGSASGSFIIKIIPALVITTSSLPGGTVGISYTATTLAATGGTPPYTWSVASGALPSGLSLSSAGVISGTPTAAGTVSVALKVTDSAQVTATGTYSVTVAAAAAPLSITTQAPLASGEVGVAYTQTFAATGGTPPYTWSVASGALPSGLSLSSAGVVSGTPTAAGTFSVTLKVTDSAQATATQSFAITVIAPVKITAATPPGGVTGVSYTQQFAATGGVTPYVWSIASGSIPTGLSLSTATGLLSGTPTTAGTYTFTIGVTDQNGQKDSAAFSITIAAPVAPLSITTQTALPGGVVGVAYTQTFAATGGTSPYQWLVSAGALPTGLTLSATGSLTGTPTTAGTFNFTVRVGDAAGRNTTASFTITVAAALTITTANPLPNATVGTPYSQTLTAVGGSGTPTWAASPGSDGAVIGNVTGLPPGISLNPSTGLLSGTPSTPGTFTFNVSVTSGGQTAIAQFFITVGVPPGPSAAITGLPATATPAMQPPPVAISIPSAYPLAITGTVTLTFASDAPSTDDPEVVFINGGRTASFTVAANTTQVVFTGGTPSVQIGTVSGTITLTLDLIAAGIDITPSPAPSTTMVIAKSAPFIKSATVTGVTSSGFNLVVVGYATSRDMLSATVTFTAASGVTLSSSSASISLASVFTTWYQSSASAAYGSQFSLTMPFTIANGTSTNPLTSVSVQLTNSQGNSTTVSATY
jgi:hypothetical protein